MARTLETVLRPGLDAKEPLRQLRRVIEAADADRLHMRTYSEQAPCGTAYCAAGFAAIDPWFREYTRINRFLHVALDPVKGDQLIEVADVPDEYDTCGDVLADIFLIDEDDAAALFALDQGDMCLGPHAVTKAEVLANIDALLAGEAAETYAACLDDDGSWDEDDDDLDDEDSLADEDDLDDEDDE